jgi:hypothetical protein
MPSLVRSELPQRVGGSWGAGSGGCSPAGGPAPASPVRTAACLSLFCCLAGRSALPLEPGDGGHRGMPRDSQGQATEPTKSATDQGCRVGSARVPGWLVECLRLGVGHASTVRPDPSTLGVAGERGSSRESCLQLVQASLSRWSLVGPRSEPELVHAEHQADFPTVVVEAMPCCAWLGDLPLLAGLWVTARRRCGFAPG